MRSFLRFLFAALVCLAVAGAGISLLIRINRGERPEAVTPMPGPSPAVARLEAVPESRPGDLPRPDRTSRVVGPGLRRPASVRRAHPGRDRAVHRQGPRRGLAPRVPRGDRPSRRAGQGAAPRAERHGSASTRQPTLGPGVAGPLGLYRQLAFVALYEGDHDEAASWLKKALALSEHAGRAGRRSGRT